MKPAIEIFLASCGCGSLVLIFSYFAVPVVFEGFYQLAGGTNSYTVDYLKKAGLFQSSNWNSGTATSEMASSHQALIGGIAYGGYARKV
jgi:hypothetical protein